MSAVNHQCIIRVTRIGTRIGLPALEAVLLNRLFKNFVVQTISQSAVSLVFACNSEKLL